MLSFVPFCVGLEISLRHFSVVLLYNFSVKMCFGHYGGLGSWCLAQISGVVIWICCLNDFTYIGVLKVYRVTKKLFVTRGNLYYCLQWRAFLLGGGGGLMQCCTILTLKWCILEHLCTFLFHVPLHWSDV